jgi:photosystem II stability/assembly factor-like uncharacterized protein
MIKFRLEQRSRLWIGRLGGVTVLGILLVPFGMSNVGASSPPVVGGWVVGGSMPSVALYSISCPSATICLAVGEATSAKRDGPGVVYRTTNGGTNWFAEPVPSGVLGLFGVSCPSVSNCVAVGGGTNGAFKPTPAQVIVTTSGGTSWTAEPIPADVMGLTAVSCSSLSDCVAVGDNPQAASGKSGDVNTTSIGTILGTTDGGSNWTVEYRLSTGKGQELYGVSCPNTVTCYAVGAGEPGVVLSTVDGGSSWLKATFPHKTWISITCPTSITCAVGGVTIHSVGNFPGTEFAVMMKTNDGGSHWSMVTTPSGTSWWTGGSIDGLSCPAITECVAVGQGGNGSYGLGAVTTDAGGIWVRNLPPSEYNTAVDCVSVMRCLVIEDVDNTNRGAYGFTGSQVVVDTNPACTAFSPGDSESYSRTTNYWIAASDGSVYACGAAPFYGSLTSLGITPTSPIVGIAATPDKKGYWLVSSDGGVFAFGDAHFYGSMGGKALDEPIVGMATMSLGGYYEVASDGGIFAFGPGTGFHGSMGGKPLNKPVVGMATTSSGGYYEVASDGGIFSFGAGTPFHGSTGCLNLGRPIVGLAVSPNSTDSGTRTACGGQKIPSPGGYVMVASDGGVFTFGNMPFAGSLGGEGIDDVAGVAFS